MPLAFTQEDFLVLHVCIHVDFTGIQNTTIISLLRQMVWGLRNTHEVTVYEQKWSPTQPCASSCERHLTEIIPKNSFFGSPRSTWSPRHTSRSVPELVFWIIFTPCLRFTGSSSGQWCRRFTSLSHTVTNLNTDAFKKLLKPHSQVHNEKFIGSLLCNHSFIRTLLHRFSNRK